MKKLQMSALLSALIITGIGIVLFLYSGDALSALLRLIGLGLLLVGGIGVAGYYMGKEDEKKSLWKMLVSAVEAIGGLIILINPHFILNIYPIAMGIIIAVDGLGNLFQALMMKRKENRSWKAMLILAIITILLGIIVILNPFSTADALTTVIGAVLVYDGVTRIIAALKK